jgi:hypothetical protein
MDKRQEGTNEESRPEGRLSVENSGLHGRAGA